MEKVQCDEPPIMELGCLASLGPFRNTYLQENMALFRGMCEFVSCSYLRNDKSYEWFLQKKCKQTHCASFLHSSYSVVLKCIFHFSSCPNTQTHGRLDVSFESKS